ncbi:MAG: hypothetical protein IPK00_26080 [Deltaproteobacteria bacterium]|nr:hypothetical protein [Deltaproteobacteria bacterium]
MSVRSAWGWLFATFVLVLPFPVLGPFGGMVPPANHLILLAATSAVAASEGAAGPVPGLLVLFALHAVVTLLAALALAWVASRLLGGLQPGVRRSLVWVAIALMLAIALSFELYTPPFGRAPTANLLGVLS